MVMAVQTHEIVPAAESDIHDEPHLSGRRLTVRTLVSAVEDSGLDPGEVADRYDLPVADVYRALTYYHDHPEEMARVAHGRRATERTAREQGVPTMDDLGEAREDGSSPL
jgi:uncharacterized protein (DUF433 family)